jgi:hypothetical protein
MHLRSFCLAALLVASCGGPQQTNPTPPPPKKIDEKPAAVLPAPQADVRGELLGSLVLGGLDSLVGAISGYLTPVLPPAIQPVVQPDALKSELFKRMHLDSVAAALDTTRPIVFAFADPEVYKQGVLGGAIVAVPLKDTSGFVDALGRIATRQETTAWKDRTFDFGGKVLRCRVEKDWGFLASDEKLLNGARSALVPLAEKGGAPGRIQLSLDMAALHARYGARMDRAVDGIAAMFNKPGTAGLKATVTRWMSYLKSTRELDLRLDLQPGKIQAVLAARAAAQGELRKYIDAMSTGDPWGAKFIPADSLLMYVNRTRADARPQMVEDVFAMIKEQGKELIDGAALDKIKDAILTAASQFGGESAGGLWVTSDGGIGVGGAVSVKNAAAAQKQIAALMKIASKTIAQLLAAVQKKAPGKMKLALNVRPGGLAVGGLKADLYELAITWPKLKDKAEQVGMIKKGLTKLFGPKPTFAFVATGETGLMAFGKDYKKRLGELVAIAKGGTGTASEKTMRELAAGRSPAMLVHTPIASVVEGAMRVADQLTTVPADVRDAINKVLPGPGKTLPVTALMHKAGDALFWELSVSPDLFATLAKAMVWMRGTSSAPPPTP